MKFLCLWPSGSKRCYELLDNLKNKGKKKTNKVTYEAG